MKKHASTAAALSFGLLVTISPSRGWAEKSTDARRLAAERGIQEKYCPVEDEKVGRQPIRAQSSAFVVSIGTADISAAVQAELEDSAASMGAVDGTIADLRAWEIETSSGGAKWVLLDFEVRGGSQPIGFTEDHLTLAVHKKNPELKFSLLHSRAQLSFPRWQPMEAYPYAVSDVDGDGVNEVILTHVGGYAANLEVFSVSSKTWTHLARGCGTSD